MLMSLLRWSGRFLLRVAMDSELKSAVNNAVLVAEKSDLKGSDKLEYALEQVKSKAGKALINETEQSLRSAIELAVESLKKKQQHRL